MPLFSRRRAKRRTVVVTLVAWGLALVAGMVNACVLHEAGPGHHGQGQARPSAVPEVQALASQAEPPGDAGEHKQPCQQFCDSEASTAVQRQGHGPTDLGNAVVHVGACTPSLAPVALVKVSFDDRPPPRPTADRHPLCAADALGRSGHAVHARSPGLEREWLLTVPGTGVAHAWRSLLDPNTSPNSIRSP